MSMLDVDKRGWMLGPMYNMHTGQLMVRRHACLCSYNLLHAAFLGVTLYMNLSCTLLKQASPKPFSRSSILCEFVFAAYEPMP